MQGCQFTSAIWDKSRKRHKKVHTITYINSSPHEYDSLGYSITRNRLTDFARCGLEWVWVKDFLLKSIHAHVIPLSLCIPFYFLTSYIYLKKRYLNYLALDEDVIQRDLQIKLEK